MRRPGSYRTRTLYLILAASIVSGQAPLRGDFTFGPPLRLAAPLNSEDGEWSPCISADELEFYVCSSRDGGLGGYDLWRCNRISTDDPWGQPENLGEPINSAGEDGNPTLSDDGLELYFNSSRPDGQGGHDLYVITRTSRTAPWSPPVNLGPRVNSAYHESAPSISGDGLELYFSYRGLSVPEDEAGFYVTTREGGRRDGPWGVPIRLGPIVNSWPCMWEPEISSDGLLLMWNGYRACDPRPGGCGGTDIWFCRRTHREGPWSAPVNLGPPINTSAHEVGPEISANGSTLYFASDRGGWYDFWQAPIVPVLDFDGDRIVGQSDLLMLRNCWGTDDSQCDIGPMPWGDGVVDQADEDLLMAQFGQEVDYPYDPRFARDPHPLSGCVVAMEGILPLRWTCTASVLQHYVYFGTDHDAVAGADTSDTTGIYRGVQDANEYAPPEGIQPCQTYFWRIDELNATGCIGKGATWSFTVGQYLIVDDFECYNEDMQAGTAIWQTWIDAFFSGTSGAIVGYMDPPFVETTVVHGGTQAMPLFYDNDGTILEKTPYEIDGVPFYSETRRTWQMPKDWTRDGIEILTLWFHGDPGNAVEPFYIALEDSRGTRRDIEHPDPTAVVMDDWEQWPIPLADFSGVDLTRIEVMAIGAGNRTGSEPGGSGLLIIDDIELHPARGQ